MTDPADICVRTSLRCNNVGCNQCALAFDVDYIDMRNLPSGLPHEHKLYLCERFGDKTYHGLIPGKLCNKFICQVPGYGNDINVCLECRGYPIEERFEYALSESGE